MHTLWLETDGKKTALASAADLPFWTDLVQFAEDKYGKERISYTFESKKSALEEAAEKEYSEAGWSEEYNRTQFGLYDDGRDGWRY